MSGNVDVTRDAPRVIHPPIDTDVVIPEAVRRAAQRAENYYKQPAEPAPVAGTQPAPTGEPAPQLQPAAAVQPAAQPAPVPEQVQAAPQPQVVDHQSTAPAEPDNWEHKFKSQQGRITALNAQQREMQNQMVDLGNELVASQRRVEELTRQMQQSVQPQREVTAQDVNDFGDFVNVAERAARDALNPTVSALQGEVQEMRQSLHAQRAQDMYRVLTQEVPQWRAINTHPTFNHWLALRDPVSGAIRKVLLDGAHQAANAARVVAIFKSFITEDAARRPAAPTAPAAPAQGDPAQVRQPAMSLEALAAPGRASSAPAANPAAEKRIYTRADITKFYHECSRGRYAGREAERAAIEFDIVNVAPREGRVRG